MTDDAKKLDMLKKMMETVWDTFKKEEIKDLDDLQFKLAKSLYSHHIDELNSFMRDSFGEDVYVKLFELGKNEYCEECEAEPENLREFVKYMFESFDEKEVLFEVVAYMAEKIEE